MRRVYNRTIGIFLIVMLAGAAVAQISITVDPTTSVSVGRELELDRSKFFGLADSGTTFENKINDQTTVDDYIDNLGMKFGRVLGQGFSVINYSPSAVQEDSGRSGYVDLTHLANNLSPNNGSASTDFINKFSPNLKIAGHDRDGAYPSFMPTWIGVDGKKYPTNVDAAGEWLAGVLEHNYTSWTRPQTYEVINEPGDSGDQRLADLHTAVDDEVDAAGLDVAVGGPCLSVGYFYKNNYQHSGLRTFINNTSGNLDFYSFHTYDYMDWDNGSSDFIGRVTSGLPLEGVLDSIQNYTYNNHGKEVDIVLSEHAGCILTSESTTLDTVARAYFPGTEDFAWQMKRRSIKEFIAMKSAIGNTMTFLNNPHVIKKAVPFVLLESAGWDPYYTSSLLVKEDFINLPSKPWHESTYINFYKLFQNVSGRRVKTELNDPDIQCQSYASDDKLYILLNNLAANTESLNMTIPTAGIQTITLRKLGRNSDFTPYYTETTTNTLAGLQILGRESIVIEVDYSSALTESTLLDEVSYYGNLTHQSYTGSRTFTVAAPSYQHAESAQLRISVGRGTGTDHQINVTFNGTSLTVPLENCAASLENSTEYGSTKLINVPTNLLQASNSIQVSFPSGSGGIGSVVLRAALSKISSDYAINCGKGSAYTAVDGTVYQTNQYVSGGWDPNLYTSPIANTEDDTLYQSEHVGASFSYNIPVLNGTYDITLQMAENWHTATNQRIFDVTVEGTLVLDDLDVFSAAGGRRIAYDYTYRTNITDGTVNIGFNASVDSAVINAIKIVDVNSAPNFTSDPFSPANATERTAYSASISSAATDADAGETLVYSKISGPSWLSIAGNGDISGTPARSDIGINTFTVRVLDGQLASDTATMTIVVDAIQLPYLGSPVNLPGTIQAENFDLGGENFGYHDTTTANQGGAFRTSEAVDLEASHGGYNIGYTTDGEWVNYIVNATGGVYDIDFRVASASATPGQISLTLDDTVLGTISVPQTHVWDWTVYQTVTLSNVTVQTASNVVLQAQFIGGNENLHWIEFKELTGYEVWTRDYAMAGASMTNHNDADGINNIMEYILGGDPTNTAVTGYEAGPNAARDFVYVMADDPRVSCQLVESTNLVTGFNMTNTSYLGSAPYSSGYLIHSNSTSLSTPQLFQKLIFEYTE